MKLVIFFLPTIAMNVLICFLENQLQQMIGLFFVVKQADYLLHKVVH